MAILNAVISWIIKKRIHQIELFIKYPHEVQNEWLKRLLNDAKDTEWGRKYDFKNIDSFEKQNALIVKLFLLFCYVAF